MHRILSNFSTTQLTIGKKTYIYLKSLYITEKNFACFENSIKSIINEEKQRFERQ